MADNFFSIDALEKFKESVKDDSDFIKFIEDLEKGGKAGVSLGEAMKHANAETKLFLRNANEAINGMKNLNDSLNQVSETAKGMWNDAIEKAKEFTNSAEGNSPIFLTHFTKIIPEAISGMGKFGGSVKEAGFDAGDAFGKMKSSITGIIDLLPDAGKKAANALLKIGGEVAEGQAAYAGMQKQIIAMAAAQGNLSGVMDGSHKHFGDLQQDYISLVNISATVGAATGQTLESVQNLMWTMKDVPKTMSEPLQATGQSMNQLVGISKMATAVGIDQTEVAKKLSEMYTNVGASGDVAFTSLANIYKHAGDSNLGFEKFSTTVSDIASGFKMLGDNTKAATNIVDSFDKSMNNISRAAFGDLIKGMGGKLQGLDLAQLGFISSQTGGPGGLAGGVQMEEAMATGKIDQVLAKTLEAMQNQFGGPVVTRKEAAESPELAGEYFKQVKYLTDVAGIAGNRQEAAQILEAMKTGVIDKLKLGQGEDGKDSLIALVDRGNEQQVKTTNQLVMQTYQIMEQTKLLRNITDNKVVSGFNSEKLMGSDSYMNNAAGMAVNATQVRTQEQFASDQIAAGGLTGQFHEGIRAGDRLARIGLDKPSGEGSTSSGVSNTINGAPVEVTKPRSGTILTNAAKQIGNVQRIQVDVSNKPLDVNVKVDLNMLGEKIRAITESVITERENKTKQRMATGAE